VVFFGPAALTTAAVSPTYTAPVMMAAKKEEPWSLDTLLRGPKEKFAGGIELLSGVSRPLNPSKMNVDGSQYDTRGVKAKKKVFKGKGLWAESGTFGDMSKK